MTIIITINQFSLTSYLMANLSITMMMIMRIITMTKKVIGNNFISKVKQNTTKKHKNKPSKDNNKFGD